jgi:hypothetical protein
MVQQHISNKEQSPLSESSLQSSAFDNASNTMASAAPPPFQLKEDASAKSSPENAPIQRVLQVNGDPDHIARVLGILNRALFGYTVTVDATGIISINTNDLVGPPSQAQQAMYTRLNSIIGHAETTNIGIESGNENTLVGSYATGQIDIADIEAMAGNIGVSDTGTLIHEIVEQFQKQVHGEDYNAPGAGERSGAHGEGINAEEEQNGLTRGTHRVVSQTANPDGTVSVVVEVPYTRPDGTGVITTLNIVNNNVVSSSEREI